ncbi:MAG: class I SAM-dependent methyltransferase, partial [Verrucomicrobiae bacterium]|nr:class I SAM-dependent methyltransferase [Verrucomicrobiae bacterium]
MKQRISLFSFLLAAGLCFSNPRGAIAAPADDTAAAIFEATGVKGGFVVHLGSGDGELTAALKASDSYVVHGLDTDAAKVASARETLLAKGVYGKVSIDRLDGKKLPYTEGTVNLVVADSDAAANWVSEDEIRRVLAPLGVAYLRTPGGDWTKIEKPWPKEIDEWTHYLHDAGGNAVAHDSVVGPPRRMKWVGSPRWSRHHDRMASM